MDPHELLLISGSPECKVNAVDALVEVANNKRQWLVVENHSGLTAHIKKRERVATVSPLKEAYMIPD